MSDQTEQILELVKDFERIRQASEWETLRWVIQQIGVHAMAPEADGFSVLKGLIEDIDARMEVSRGQDH